MAKKDVKKTIKPDVTTPEDDFMTPEPENETKEQETSKDKSENSKGEPMDFIQYCCEPNIRIGTDYRKEIKFRMDGKDMKAVIRPVSSDEIALVQSTSDMGQGSVDKLLVSMAVYSTDGTSKIPDMILDKIPSGVTSYIASEIMSLSGYNLDNDAVSFLKKP